MTNSRSLLSINFLATIIIVVVILLTPNTGRLSNT